MHVTPEDHIEIVVVQGAITLGQFLKWSGLADSGGEAKLLVETGSARVNGAVERRRGHRLAAGDVVEVAGRARRVGVGPEDASHDAG
jgi:Uncharacterized conserved protein